MKNIELNQQSKLDKGTIIEVIGPVVNVQFPSNSLPKIYDALKVKLADGSDLILEVEQLAGDGIVKCISMGSTEGLTRGITVEQTGNPILAPVGEGVLGRMFNVVGQPIDNLPLPTKDISSTSSQA